MKQVLFEISENSMIAHDTYLMKLHGDVSGFAAPGQFIGIKLPGHFLRRPISVCDIDDKGLTIIYKTLGKGTAEMASFHIGMTLDVLTALGNGYELSDAGQTPLIIGGGVGIPPLYLLAKMLLKKGKTPTVVMGFNSKEDIFYEDKFSELGCPVLVTTADGSHGICGFAVDALRGGSFSYIYTCGPIPMLKSVYDFASKHDIDGQFSFEERMGCGFGACMGCSIRVNALDEFGMHTGEISYKRVCKEGPVFRKEEIIW